MKLEQYVDANRSAWNDAASFHESSDYFAELLAGFKQPGYSILDEDEIYWLNEIGVQGKSVAQLCCNNGREILSIENMGAASCVGFDISANFLDQARRLAQAGNLHCQFVETDVCDIPIEFDQQFDLCIVTIGVFGWMSDLNLFFGTVDRLLKPGGTLFVHEEHPIMNMFEPHARNPFELVSSYFRREPFEESGIIVYDGEQKGEGATHYWFVHPLSEILTRCLENGLRLETIKENPYNISSAEFDVYEEQEAQLPMSYILIASKETK